MSCKCALFLGHKLDFFCHVFSHATVMSLIMPFCVKLCQMTDVKAIHLSCTCHSCHYIMMSRGPDVNLTFRFIYLSVHV